MPHPAPLWITGVCPFAGSWSGCTRGARLSGRMKDALIPSDGRPFSLAAGIAAGLGRGELAGPRFARPFHGVRELRVPGEQRHGTREQLRRGCEQYAVRLRGGQFFYGETALVLLGAPAPERWKSVVHVAAYRPADAPRTRGVVGHRLAARAAAPWSVFGLRVEHPARALVQAAGTWAADDIIAAADFLIARRKPLVTLDQLRAEASHARRPHLHGLLDQVRDGSESPRETRLRLAIVRAGLPEPELAWELYTPEGEFVARIDQAYLRYRVAVEYDGRQHADDVAQFERDADRWDAIRAQGWDHVRILRHHLAGDGAVAVEKVRTALLRAGWRP